jgi:Predicted ATPase
MKELTHTLLQESDDKLQQWKDNLQKALMDNGQLIIDMVPEFEAVIGPQQALSELGPAESKNRFLHIYGNFIKVFADKQHPLTILLDDLQWCDRPSLELIGYLLKRDDLESLLLIGCYRDNELLEGHPLLTLMEEWRGQEKSVAFPVKQLEAEHIVQMLTDMSLEKNCIQSLAEIVYRKTQGNPFFVHELLRHLFKEHYISFNENLHHWECNVNLIEGITISDNIVDFMIGQLRKLPKETQDILKLAALIGSSVELRMLSLVAEGSVSQVMETLQKAIEDEIIRLNRGNDKKTITNFRFAHDRIQQACVELMDLDQKRMLHLKIGRVMMSNTPRDQWKDYAMDMVCHFNEALDEIDTDEECWETINLNLWAFQKAKGSSAFYMALRYIENSIYLLPENAWEQDYNLTFIIYKYYIECAYLNNEYTRAEEQVQYLLQHAKSSMEQAEIRWLQSTLFNYQGKLDEAIQYAIQGLQLLKMRVQVNPMMIRLFKEMIAVKTRLWGKSRDTLLNLQPMENERIKLALELWNEINRAAYLHGNTNLFLMSILKQMQMTLRFGNSKNSGKTYVAYAMILAILGDLQGTYDFCELARMSCEKEGCFESKPTILFSSGFFGHAWNRSWRNIEQWFESSMEEAVKYGDHHTIAMAGPFMYAFKPDESIKILVDKAMNQFALVKQTNNQLAFHFSFLMIHRWLNYMGKTDDLFSMSLSKLTYKKNGGIGIILSEEECLDNLREGNFLSSLGIYYKEKMYIHYLYDDYAGAMKYLKEAERYFKYHAGTPYLVECRMCSFLVLAANIRDLEEKEVRKAKGRLRKHYQYIKGLAKHCAVNFEHLQYIMEAELARIDNRPHEAIELFDKAIQIARQNGFMRDEALADELAAKLLIWRGKEKQAAVYLSEALKGYKLWGAEAKAGHMKEKFGYLLKESGYQEGVLEIAVTSEVLDEISVEKASKAVLSDSPMPDLVDQILKTVIENSGAQRAIIILKSEKGWRIVAEAKTGTLEEKIFRPIPIDQGDNIIPSFVINYCIRTGEHIVLSDAIKANRFNKDPYIQQNCIRSLLCMPILNQGNMGGILYLENNLSADVFTKNRIEILRILAGQFLNSINNVKLFIDLLAKTEEVHKASEEVLRSDIAFLQAQIKPHFLYNAINTISAFSLDDSQMTRDLLAKLSEYLRGSFDFKNRDKLITLSKELELVEAYLFIEKARFGDRLRVIYDIDENADCLLPPLVIEPLVENAVQHGLANRKNGGTVKITVQGDKDYMIITVEDDGDGMDEAVYVRLFEDDIGKSGGIALKNIQRRLMQLYGRGLEVERKATGGTKITMHIEK